MKRKDFLSSVVGAGALIPSWKNMVADVPEASHIQPPYLKKGDTIGITSPAGYITAEELRPAVLQMESWGFKIRYGNTIGKRDATFGGTDDERRHDLQQMLDDQ